MNKQLLIYYFLLISFISTSLTATNYYCDPVNGSMSNDGESQTSAWTTLSAVVGKTFNSGDIIFLMNGAHGRAYIANSNTGYVTFKALDGHLPKVAGVQFADNTSYWAFDGLTFTADGTGGDFSTSFINSKISTTNIKITNCDFYMAENSSLWSFDDWYTYTQEQSYYALRIRGDGFIFNNNHIKNVYFGILTEGSNIEINNNIIENFGADAIQMQNCSNVHIEGNIIRNAYLENYDGYVGGHPSNHDDAIQLLGLTATLDNIVILRNKIYNFIDPISQDMIDNNLVGFKMQGIFLTNGHITNSLFENNLVIIDTYHGITLNSSNNARIQNNTVLRNPNPINPQDIRTWIAFYGEESSSHTQGVIRNNIAYQFVTADGNVNENNIELSSSNVNDYFLDYSNYNFTSLSSSPAIDAGVNTNLSDIDLAGNNRLYGANVDVGAYEYGSTLSLFSTDISHNFSVYPTKIIDGTITLKVSKQIIGKEVEIKLITIEGKIIIAETIIINSIKTIIPIDEIYNSNSSIYLMNISNNKMSETFKLLK